MEATQGETEGATGPTVRASAMPARHALREQDLLWTRFLAMGQTVVDSLAKSTDALCNGRLEVVSEVKDVEKESDREEVWIEQECLRMLALYDPVASDLRRLATILKVNRNWERIADQAARIARRARKLARKSDDVPVPEPLQVLACDVLTHVKSSYDALLGRDVARAGAVVAADRAVARRYRLVRKALKEGLREHAGQSKAWLRLLSTARNLKRICDHATDIAETIVFLQDGVIIRHQKQTGASNP
jgi:phosphate transport system protein